jgi:hypothetical protein
LRHQRVWVQRNGSHKSLELCGALASGLGRVSRVRRTPGLLAVQRTRSIKD